MTLLRTILVLVRIGWNNVRGKYNPTKGEVSVTAAIIGSVGMVIVAIISSWATSNATVSDVKTQVATVIERENNHYEEVQKQLMFTASAINSIDTNLKALLEAQGVRQAIIKKP